MIYYIRLIAAFRKVYTLVAVCVQKLPLDDGKLLYLHILLQRVAWAVLHEVSGRLAECAKLDVPEALHHRALGILSHIDISFGGGIARMRPYVSLENVN